MEKWQSDHILHNLQQLTKLTDCNLSLLIILQSQSILSDEDFQFIESKETSLEKSYHLYEILRKRMESYKALISALQDTSQSGAMEILVAGFIMHGTIKFQENLTSLSELLPNLDENLKKKLIGLLLQQPCVDNVVVKNTIPCNLKLDYYIPRTILSRRKLKKSLFQEKCLDVFLFQGLELHELSHLADKMPTDVSSNLLSPSSQLQTRHVVLESSKHLDKIFNKTENPVHLIQYTNGNYHWIKSKGEVKTIQKFIEGSVTMKEECLIEEIIKDNRSVCLTDSPGMGKTILLANLARSIVDRYPTRLVIFVVLREFIPALQAKLINQTRLDILTIKTLLTEYISDDPVGRRLVSHKLENDQTHLCFDGFDEILLEQRELAKSMLNFISSSFQNCQTLVTARLHLREELEQTLGTLGFQIASFDKSNQIEFLEKYWKARGAESENLREYAEICLTNLDHISESEQDIAGIPLQCYVIGKLFFDRADCKNPASVLGAEVTITSMAQLYDNLINMKLDTLKVEYEGMKESLIQAHIYYAMTLLFPQEVGSFVEYPVKISHEKLYRVGIIEPVADAGLVNRIRFVHETFAEFFVGLFAAKLLQNLDKMSVKLLFKKILATYFKREHLIDNPFGRKRYILLVRLYQHPVIAYFLNFQLKQQKLLLKSNLNIRFARVQLTQSFVAAVCHGNLELLNLHVSLSGKRQNQILLTTEVLWSTLQFVAAKHHDVGVLKKVIELSKKKCLGEFQMENSSESQIRVIFSPLYVACFFGNYQVVEFLIQSKHVSLNSAQFGLHVCMWYSSLQSEAIIKRKVQIIKYLGSQLSSVLHTKLLGLTPILGKYVHLDLLKCALESGASICDRAGDLKTLLHIAPEYMTPKEYHKLVIFLIKSFAVDILSARDAFGCTPLHYAVQYLPILSDTLQIFLNYGVEINAKDNEGNSVLFYALQHQTETTLELLMTNGAELDGKNLAQETALEIKNTVTLKNFLVRDSEDVKFKSRSDQKTSLSFPDPFDTKTNLDVNTPLHIEFCQRRVNLEKVKYQFSINADFNATNVDGDTPLHLGVLKSKIFKKVLDFAINEGKADLNLVNNSGLSVLGQAIFAQRNIRFLKLLVEYGEDVCRLRNFTAAISGGNLKYVKFLLEHGADILKVSGEGEKGENPIQAALMVHEKANFIISKFLITSIPQLKFDDQECITEIVVCALRAYEKSVKFRTVELFNLMALRGLNYAHCHVTNEPILFVVISVLSPTDCISFVTHLSAVGLRRLFHIQDSDGYDLLFHCVRKFETDTKFLSVFSVNEVDFNLKNIHGNVLRPAIMNNFNKEILERLIFFGADPNVLDESGNNFINLSIFCQSHEAIETLLSAGISFHLENQLGYTPLMQTCYWYICGKISLETFEFVARLADLSKLNSSQVYLLCLYITALYDLEHDKKLTKVFQTLIHEMYQTLFEDVLPTFFYIMQYLTVENAETFLKLLAQAGYTNFGTVKNSESMNVLQYFIKYANADFPIKLLPLLGNVNQILNSEDSCGWSVLVYSAFYGKSVEYMKLLIENGANINHITRRGISLLHFAAHTGDLNSVEFFVDQVNDKNCVDIDGYSALQYSFDYYTDKHYNVAKLLVGKGVCLNLESYSGMKTIEKCLRAYKTSESFKFAEIFTLMLSHGLDIESSCRFGSPILFKMINILSSEHCEEVLTYLHVTNNTQCFHLRGHYGDTLLHRCVQNFEPSVELLNIFKLVGTDFDAKDMLGNSVLCYAVLANRTKPTLSRLISLGAKDEWNIDGTNGNNIFNTVVKRGKQLFRKIMNR